MKKIILILFFFFISFSTINAQSINDYGIKVGLAISNLEWKYNTYPGDELELYWDNELGVTARIYADFFDYSFFNLNCELSYTQKGTKYKIPITTTAQPDGTGEYINVNNKLSYLSIAVMGKFKYDCNSFTPYILLGPQYNYLLNKQIEKGFEIVYDKFSKSNLGITLGIGTEINLTAVTLSVEYRYERDLTNNYESSTIYIRNYSHNILVGIKLS